MFNSTNNPTDETPGSYSTNPAPQCTFSVQREKNVKKQDLHFPTPLSAPPLSQTDPAQNEEQSLAVHPETEPDVTVEAESEEETQGTWSEMAVENSQCDIESGNEYDDIENGSDEDTDSSAVIVTLSKTFSSSQLYSTSSIYLFLDLRKGDKLKIEAFPLIYHVFTCPVTLHCSMPLSENSTNRSTIT